MNKKEDLDNFEWFNLNLTIDDQFFDDETDNLYKKLKFSWRVASQTALSAAIGKLGIVTSNKLGLAPPPRGIEVIL